MKELTEFLFYIGILIHLFIIIKESTKKMYVFRYPFLYSIAVIGWVYPQIYSMIYQNLYVNILWKLEIFIILCAIAVYIGFYKNKRLISNISININIKKLVWFNLIIFFVGAFFYHKVSQMAEEATLLFGGQWQGIITVYVFFAKLLSISLGTALVIDLYKKSLVNYFIILGSSYFYLERIILGGRREDAFEFFMMILLWLLWKKNFVIPRILFLILAFVGVVFVNLVGIYRGLTIFTGGRLEMFLMKINMVFTVDWINAFKEYITSGANEVLNATLIISSSEKLLSFDFGLSIWNAFVHFYIPATFLGREFKQSLMFDFPDVAYEVYGHVPIVGSTVTGYADAFQSFWYFGFVKFFLIAYLMGLIFRSAMYSPNLVAKIVITQVYAVSILAITHTTHHFFLEFIKLAVFLMPILYLSKHRRVRSFHV